MPLGLFDSAELHDSTTLLKPDDVLCLFTDGLVESRRHGDMFGAERLSEPLIKHADLPLTNLAADVVAAVRSFHGHNLADELALLLVRPSSLTR